MEDEDLVDAVSSLADAGKRIASAILPPGVAPGHDATGGTIDSLTEAVMGVTGGLVRIAEAISDLADAVRDHKRKR